MMTARNKYACKKNIIAHSHYYYNNHNGMKRESGQFAVRDNAFHNAEKFLFQNVRATIETMDISRLPRMCDELQETLVWELHGGVKLDRGLNSRHQFRVISSLCSRVG